MMDKHYEVEYRVLADSTCHLLKEQFYFVEDSKSLDHAIDFYGFELMKNYDAECVDVLSVEEINLDDC